MPEALPLGIFWRMVVIKEDFNSPEMTFKRMLDKHGKNVGAIDWFKTNGDWYIVSSRLDGKDVIDWLDRIEPVVVDYDILTSDDQVNGRVPYDWNFAFDNASYLGIEKFSIIRVMNIEFSDMEESTAKTSRPRLSEATIREMCKQDLGLFSEIF